MNPVRRRLDTSVHRLVRASSRTRTQHRGTRTRTRSDFLSQSGPLVFKLPRTAAINDRHRRSSNSHRVRVRRNPIRGTIKLHA
jgi:hypothetical protein